MSSAHVLRPRRPNRPRRTAEGRATFRQVATTTFSTVLLALGVASVLAAVLGVRLVPVLSGSMTPYADVGSLAVTVPAESREIHVGDVVAFRPPLEFTVSQHRPIMHRVATMDVTSPEPWLSTKGDANPDPDPWRLSLDGTDFTRTVLVLPHLGHPAAGGRWAVALLLAGTALLYAVRHVTARTISTCTCPGDRSSTVDAESPRSDRLPATEPAARRLPPQHGHLSVGHQLPGDGDLRVGSRSMTRWQPTGDRRATWSAPSPGTASGRVAVTTSPRVRREERAPRTR